jgi:hypothetical protein
MRETKPLHLTTWIRVHSAQENDKRTNSVSAAYDVLWYRDNNGTAQEAGII